jgi:molybdate transport system ATP-binding protein
VSGHDEAEHVTQVAAGSGRILLARQKIAIGERLRLRIQARDVSLALSRASDSSILNILPCTVREISEAGVGQCLVRLTLDTLDEQLLLARVTQRSVQHLSLQPGMALFAQIKSVALA